MNNAVDAVETEQTREGLVYRYMCPHCSLLLEVQQNDLNCCIFRHGVIKGQGPVNPHASQQEIQRLKQTGKLIGCGGPHRLICVDGTTAKWIVQICSWDS